MNRRVLVTGASGFVGQGLCPVLEKAGWAIRRASRNPPMDFGWARIADLGPDTGWQEALEGCDAVVHLAARVHVSSTSDASTRAALHLANASGPERLAREAARLGVGRFILMSSIKVNGEATDKACPFQADDPPRPEDTYGESKWAGEQALARVGSETGMEWVVLRPPLIHGPGVGANFLRMLRWIHHGLPLPLGKVDNLRSLLGLANLADIVTLCLDHPGAAQKVILASDGEDISTPELFRRLAKHMGRSARLPALPLGVLEGLGRMTGLEAVLAKLTGSLRVDTRFLREDLGWIPLNSLDAGLAATVDWFMAGMKR